MSAPKARLGDAHNHGGIIVEASPNVSVNGIPCARKGDRVTCPIHGDNAIATGSGTIIVNGRGQARVGDKTQCGATITGGSASVFGDDI